MSMIKAIQVKRRQAGLIDDDDWRDFLFLQTAKRRLTEMTPREQAAVLDKLSETVGSKGASKPVRKGLEGPYIPKIRALWIGAWNLGLVASSSDAALTAFVKRQTGIDNPGWMRDAEDARKVIEALKAMMEREGVRWSFAKFEPPHVRLPGFQITLAQFRIVHGGKDFFGWVAAQAGKTVGAMGYEDWIPLMNALGPRVREHNGTSRQSEGRA